MKKHFNLKHFLAILHRSLFIQRVIWEYSRAYCKPIKEDKLGKKIDLSNDSTHMFAKKVHFHGKSPLILMVWY